MENKMDRQLPLENRAQRSEIVNAVKNKILAPRNKGIGNKSRVPSVPELAPIVQSKINDIHIAEQIFDVIPDMEQAAEIAVASILSSKDLMTTSVNFDMDSKGLTIELRDRMEKYLSRYFRKELRIQDYLQDIVNDTMFMTGAYAIAIIPESSVDRIINGVDYGKVSTESLSESVNEPRGILGSINDDNGNSAKLGFEAVALNQGESSVNEIDLGLTKIHVTDNPDVLKVPELQKRLTHHKIMTTYNSEALDSLLGPEEGDETGVGVESLTINRGLYKNPLYTAKQVEEVDAAEHLHRPTVGHPMIATFPAESIIPIHVPGNIKKHVGYLVVLDNLGNPVSKEDLVNSQVDYDKEIYTAEDKHTMDMLQKLKPGIIEPGKKDERLEYTKHEVTQLFTDVVEGKLINALKNGTYGDNAMLTTPNDVYQIMLARAMSQKSTQVLFIPSEQMTYFAINYNEYGQGKSVLDRGRMLSTIRTSLAFATMRASILNATENREYTITLDEDDLEPELTVNKALSRIRQGFNGNIPYTGGPHDVLGHMTNAGISINVEGNENYASTKIELSDNSPDYKVPDTDLDEQYARRMYRMMGVDPDLVLSPENIEFASQIVTKDLFTSRRIAKLQEVFSLGLTHLVKSYTLSSGTLIKGLIEIIDEYYKETGSEKKLNRALKGQLVRRAIAQLDVTLPTPDTGGISSTLEQFNDVRDAIDEYLEVIVHDDVMGDIDVDVDVDVVRQHIRNSYLRSWIRRNNVDDDLMQLFEDSEYATQYVRGLAKENKDMADLIARIGKGIEKRLETVERKHGETDYDETEEEAPGETPPEPEVPADDETGGEPTDDDAAASEVDDPASDDNVEGTDDDAAANADTDVDADPDAASTEEEVEDPEAEPTEGDEPADSEADNPEQQ